MKKYWLMKSEPDVFSFQDLLAKPDQTTCWEGVRNYQARNFMRDDMRVGDLVLFYHSNCKEPHVAGIAEITREAYPDPTCWDENSPYYDPKSSKENPRWVMVDVTFRKGGEFTDLVTLKMIRETPALKDMKLIQRGQRLSIQPVTRDEFTKVCRMGGVTPKAIGI